MKQGAMLFLLGFLSFIAIQYTFEYLSGKCVISVMTILQQRMFQ